MPEDAAFTVNWGKYVRTVDYRDAQYSTLFTFDVSDKGEGWLALEHHAPSITRHPNYDVAFARAKRFLEARNFRVEE